MFTLALDYLRNKSGPIWHCRMPKEKPPRAHYYAYRVDGPTPGEFVGTHLTPKNCSSIPMPVGLFPSAFDREAATAPGSNEGKAPLALLHTAKQCAFDWGDDRPVRHTPI